MTRTPTYDEILQDLYEEAGRIETVQATLPEADDRQLRKAASFRTAHRIVADHRDHRGRR